jgi:hypothetical protein
MRLPTGAKEEAAPMGAGAERTFLYLMKIRQQWMIGIERVDVMTFVIVGMTDNLRSTAIGD